MKRIFYVRKQGRKNPHICIKRVTFRERELQSNDFKRFANTNLKTLLKILPMFCFYGILPKSKNEYFYHVMYLSSNKGR